MRGLAARTGRRARSERRAARPPRAYIVDRIVNPPSEPNAAPRPAGASAELFRLLVEAVEEYAIYLVDPEGRIASWNAGAARIKGYRAEEIVGKHLSVLFTPEDVAAGAPWRELAEAEHHGTAQREGWRVRKDGSRFWASVVLTALRDPEGALVGFAKVTRDMSERRRAEEVQRELEVARRAVEVRDEFLAIASHELRTPVTSLLLMAQATRRWAERSAGALPPAQERQMVEIERQSQRLTTLIDNLLEVTTLTRGPPVRLALRKADLGDIAADLVRRMASHAARRGVALSLDRAGPADGEWDSGRVEEALAALVDNAIKYGERRPVVVRVTADGTWARAAVADAGIGVRAEDQARIFERFERAVPLHHFSGFGVGLWAARQIAAAHGGDIEVRSAPGQGSVFELRLPRRVVDREAGLSEARPALH